MSAAGDDPLGVTPTRTEQRPAEDPAHTDRRDRPAGPVALALAKLAARQRLDAWIAEHCGRRPGGRRV